jgi:hypothetical protein
MADPMSPPVGHPGVEPVTPGYPCGVTGQDDDGRGGDRDDVRPDDVRPGPAEPRLPDASRHADAALAAQRGRHQAADDEVDDAGIGALVVNTGLDGDAASG